MPKAAYPTLTDLGKFVAATFLLPQSTVPTGANSATQTLLSVIGLSVGDTLYFPNAQASATILSIAQAPASTVTLSVSVNTSSGEQAIAFPAVLDLASGIAAGIARFERSVGRTMLALADSARTFDPPTNAQGMLDLRADLCALTSLTWLGTLYVLGTDFRLQPSDAAAEGKPWNRIQFRNRWLYPNTWAAQDGVVITGRWGYSTTPGGMPDDAWTAMLMAGAIDRLPQLATALARGLVSYTEAGISETFGPRPLLGLETAWNTNFDATVARYRRRVVGL